jgi:hypothetical protein
VRFWSSWGRAFGANVQTSGRTTTGFSTMTTRPLKHHLFFDNSWLPKTLQWFPPPFTWPRPLWLSPIHKTKLRLKGPRFDTTKEIHAESQEVIDTHIWELPEMYETMGNTLGSLYACPRGLLRRRQWKLGVTVINFFYGQIPRSFG